MFRWVIIIGWMLSSSVALAAAVKEGRLDLSQENLGAKSKLELGGLWHFYPKVFLHGQDFAEGLPAMPTPVLAPVPGALVGLPGPDGQPLPSDIWGSFVLELHHVPVWAVDLGLRMRGDTAYKVLLISPMVSPDTQIIAQAGLPGSRYQESIPQIIEPLSRFKAPLGAGPFYLVVHLSGFHYVSPSIWVAPTIGPISVMERQRDWVRLSEVFIVGMLLIMALYNFSLYMHRNEDASSLWLAGFCGLIMLRFIATSGSITAFIFPVSNANLFEAIRKVEFASMGLAASCLLVFIIRTFGYSRWESQLKWNHIPVLLVTVFIAVTDATIYPKILPLILLHSVIVSLLVLGLIILSMRRRHKGSILAFLGMISVLTCGWHDILIGLGYLQTPIFLMPYGMVALVFTQGQVIARLFSSAFRTADRLGRHLSEEVEVQTRDIRSMLDHIPQGVMNVVASGVIDAGCSAHLHKILGLDSIAGKTLDQILLARSTLSADDRDRIQSVLNNCLGETVLAFELNSAQLPGEVLLQCENGLKTLQMTWNPVLDKSGVVIKILVTCHDVTEVRSYEAEARAQKRELSFIQELVDISSEKFAIFYDASMRMLDENQRLINLNRNRNFEILKILFVNMHTIKGAARTLGLAQLAARMHEIEQVYASLLKDPDQDWDQHRLGDDVGKTREMIEYYKRVNEKKLGRVIEKSSMVSVDREFLVQHTQMLRQLENDAGSGLKQALLDALSKFEELAFQDSSAVLQEICGPVEKIARDLGKAPPRIMISGFQYGLSFQAQQLLRKVLIHIIRNAMDHGIETTDERLKHGKKPEGVLHFVLSEVRNRLQITISDDGRGLPLNKLERRALELGLLSASHTTSVEQVADLIFHPGLSTADSLTEVSGRGIGMDAVKSFIEEAGGSIRVLVENPQLRLDHCPFSLMISLPSTLYLRKSTGSATPISSAS